MSIQKKISVVGFGYWGKNHAQVFLHYNEKGGEYDILYDGRPMLGMVGSLKSEESKKLQDKQVKVEETNKFKKIIY